MLVHNYLERWAEHLPDKIALISQGKEYTYASLNQKSNHLANWLIDNNINLQDRVLIFLDNSPEVVASLFGIMKAGAIFVLLNPAMKAKKLHYILNNSDTKVLITHANKLRVVRNAVGQLPHLEHVIVCSDSKLSDDSNIKKQLPSLNISTWSSIETYQTNRKSDRSPRIVDIDLATIRYTSGSTGNPKGVMSAHVNIVTAIRSITQYLQHVSKDIILCALPLSFDYGLYQILMGIKIGGTVVLEKTFVFPYKVLEQIPRYKITGFPIVPSMLGLMFELEHLDRFDCASLRYISNTAAALPPKYIKRVRELWPHVDIYSLYGLTECKGVCFLPPEKINSHPNSLGIPMPNVDIAIIGDNDKKALPGETGELVVRGSNVMQGYWKLPKETEKTFRSGHYRGDVRLHSGDYFKQDNDGYLYFVGRKDDMIKTNGEIVSSREIEDAICTIKDILEAAVVGYPDEIAGQVIRAHIVSQNPSLSKKNVLKHCKENLEPLMIPKVVNFEQSLLKNTNGKIDKKKLARNNGERRSIIDRRNNLVPSASLHYGSINRRKLTDRRSGEDRRQSLLF